jgi:class 3 adenylate cyclase
MNRRLIIFLTIFVAMNLVFIPLLSLYGLRVCPVLSIPGFGFGCYYASAFILIVNLCNVLLIFSARIGKKKLLFFFADRQQNRPWAYAASYALATGFALVFLQLMLHANHLNGHSRAPEILTFASLLLGLTQAYGLNWALEDSPPSTPEVHTISFQRRWLSHVARTMLPVAIAIGLLIHFLISQAQGFNEGSIAPLVSHDVLIEQTSYVILFLLAWLVITFSFHFLSERDHVKSVQNHIGTLRGLDFKYRSDLKAAWGLWAAILEQLNAFSKILGERTRLLKTFSRFVTAGVAESALHEELKEATGTTKELTVLMSDIRNFTGISEALTPNQVVTLLNEYFTAMLDVIALFQINVDKFIGDGILAYVDSEDNKDAIAENRLGVDAALAMIERVEKLNTHLATLALPSIKIGIGIFRGPLVIGLIGSEAKLQHTTPSTEPQDLKAFANNSVLAS